jgi:hypothetical protein
MPASVLLRADVSAMADIREMERAKRERPARSGVSEIQSCVLTNHPHARLRL